MSFQVVFLHSAEQDLKELKSYVIRNFGKNTWQHSYDKLKEAVNNLQKFPLEGKIPDEIQRLNLSQYRQVISGMNRIIYEIRQETIFIHIVCDTRKDMRTLLTTRLLRI
ncbi:type II toxin-antitoxin system RelE/ParE family toxin [Collimonas pratensis]|uniref:Plasmid stabilization system family protein n=1 Tax=Collimonas pratensis TaxID=279113 RepID=A0ABN4MIP6_9BURK|nr:type II toxin-antitoxin system RelE/ParE family toxin [Collimonas pratensis]AMP17162.1 plasmid stabilization system family protein [Collimonas pratensis]